MSPEQRFLFDMAGYLHVPAALTGEALAAAQAAAARYINTIDDSPPFVGLPEGFGNAPDSFQWRRMSEDLTVLPNGFAFDPALEALVHHPATWPIIMELTHGRPRFTGGSLMMNTFGQWFHPIRKF